MSIFENKMRKIAKGTNAYLNRFLIKKNFNSSLIKPMKYALFSGGKKIKNQKFRQ